MLKDDFLYGILFGCILMQGDRINLSKIDQGYLALIKVCSQSIPKANL